MKLLIFYKTMKFFSKIFVLSLFMSIAFALSQNVPGELMYLGKPIDPLCFFNIESKNDALNLSDTKVYIFGDKCERRSICIDLAASNEDQNSDKISLGPLGTWPKYAIIIGGCILGLALLGALYLVYRRNVGYKSAGSPIRTGWRRRDFEHSPIAFL